MGSASRRGDVRRATDVALVVALSIAAVAIQVAADARIAVPPAERSVVWVQSTGVMKRLALGFDALLADVYWIRAVQYYGSTKLSTDAGKTYDLLYPLLDMTTSLDPDFRIAYRFGAILLSEPYPNGPGRPDQALALLQKGIEQSPERWEYYHDAGFVYFWWYRDEPQAAEWFLRASKIEGSPEWLPQVAASMLVHGNEPESARALWQRLAESEQEWMRESAKRGLLRLDAEQAIEQLLAVVNRFYDDAGRFPASWQELVRTRRLPGVPVDPSGTPYVLDPVSGQVTVARNSYLFPLRREHLATAANTPSADTGR